MSEAREPLRRIAVAGDGPLGALAALALKRALPGAQVLVIGTSPDPAAFGERSPTALPFSLRLLARLGVNEEELVLKCGGSHRLAIRYLHGEEQGVAAYGEEVDPRKHTGFAKNWGGGPRNASQLAPPGSLSEILAANGRFSPPAPGAQSPLAGIEYALRWHVGALRALLADKAREAGVQRMAGAISAVRPDGRGGTAAVSVEGTGEIEADLFVDCSGPAAAILSHLPEAKRLEWSRELPLRAVMFGQPGQPIAALEDRVTATDCGWRWEVAGRDGLAAILGVAAGADEVSAARALGGEATPVPLSPGRAESPWIGNVVALGDAATQVDPLCGFAADLAHRQLDLLLELLPGREVHPLERDEFNRRAGLMADRTRDVLTAHLHAPAMRGAFPEIELSDELQLALDQFTRRARVPFFEESPLLTQEWASLLAALGYEAGEGAMALTADMRVMESEARAFAARADAALRTAPPYREWLGKVLSAPT